MNRSAVDALGAARGAKIICLGDVMLDRYVYGSVTRVSPEAPIPVLAYERSTSMPGGAANAAINAAALGADVVLVGVVGRDEGGEALTDALARAPGVEPRLVQTTDRRTTEKTRFVSGGQQFLRLDAEDNAPITEAVEAEITATLEEVATGASVIMISDYAKGLMTKRVIDAALSVGSLNGAKTIADPKGDDFTRYGAVDLLKPNAAELAGALGASVDSDAEIAEAMAAAFDRCDAGAVLVTRAAKGLAYCQRGAVPAYVRGRARSVYDVSGAGDTSLAACAVALAGGGDLAACADLAVTASGLAVEKAGTASVSADEVFEALSGRSHAGALSLDDLKARVEEWRGRGLTIGFTNGCFDLLHSGHVALIEAARGLCDRLIVGLNSDQSVSRLKGADRPVNAATDRAAVLLGLAAVDAVTVFEEDTPADLISALSPDVLVKGGDYAEHEIVGAETVKAAGGDVVIVPLVEGRSTTGQIAKIRRDEGD